MPVHFPPEDLHMPKDPEGPSCLSSLVSTSNIATSNVQHPKPTNYPQKRLTGEAIKMANLTLSWLDESPKSGGVQILMFPYFCILSPIGETWGVCVCVCVFVSVCVWQQMDMVRE